MFRTFGILCVALFIYYFEMNHTLNDKTCLWLNLPISPSVIPLIFCVISLPCHIIDRSEHVQCIICMSLLSREKRHTLCEILRSFKLLFTLEHTCSWLKPHNKRESRYLRCMSSNSNWEIFTYLLQTLQKSTWWNIFCWYFT